MLDSSINFYLGFQKLSIEETYRYLGVVLCRNLSWKTHKEALYKKAYKRLVVALQIIRNGLTFDAANNFWSTMVRPVLEYGAEVWGHCAWREAECAQTLLGRNLLGVSCMTATDAVRGELGWWTMKARRDMCILRFWGKIVSGDKNALVSKVYQQRFLELKEGKKSWCGRVRALLTDLHLDQIWQDQAVGPYKDWCRLVRASIETREVTQWRANMEAKPKLRLYRRLKRGLYQERYLTYLPLWRRKYLTMMRVGTHKLRVETGRWANEPLQQRICKVCTADKIEDELHVVVECQVYATEREELLARVQDIVGYDLKPMNNDALLEVLLGIDPLHEETGNLVHAEVAKYLTKALRIRDSVLNNLKDSNEDDTHDSDCKDDRGESGDEM